MASGYHFGLPSPAEEKVPQGLLCLEVGLSVLEAQGETAVMFRSNHHSLVSIFSPAFLWVVKGIFLITQTLNQTQTIQSWPPLPLPHGAQLLFLVLQQGLEASAEIGVSVPPGAAVTHRGRMHGQNPPEAARL